MTNLLTVLPDFDLGPFSHIIRSLEQAAITTADILSLDVLDVAKRARIPPDEVKKLAEALIAALQVNLSLQQHDRSSAGSTNSDTTKSNANLDINVISTLDNALDLALGGGIYPRCLTEIAGESAVGKTQFLLTLLLAVQLPSPYGLGKAALYISTEAPLQTLRLQQILDNHPVLSALPELDKPSLNRIQSMQIHDVESQDHVLRYQVPVAIQRLKVGILVIDSIAANYRAEFDKGKGRGGAESFAQRSSQVAQLGAVLRQLAQTHNIAVVVANQVADRFDSLQPSSQGFESSQILQQSSSYSGQIDSTQTKPPSSGMLPQTPATTVQLSTTDPLSLDHQQRFFTGWGDDPNGTNLKTPSLGLIWTNQLATRIVLTRQPIYAQRTYRPGEERDISAWKRQCKLVFSSWCGESLSDIEIWKGGVRTRDAGTGLRGE